jgi:dihydrofolate reductase
VKLTVTTFVTLDGVMQGPGGVTEDPSNGFELGGWVMPFADEGFGRHITEIFERAEAILLGRTTYDLMYPYWSQVADPDDVVATALNGLPKHVVTHRPTDLGWANSHPITGDVVATISDLKGQPGGELQVHGSHGLIQTLLTAELVDEFNVFVFPVLLGDGKRLFGEGTKPATVSLVGTEVTDAGVMVATYRPAGPLVQQTVPGVDPSEGA